MCEGKFFLVANGFFIPFLATLGESGLPFGELYYFAVFFLFKTPLDEFELCWIYGFDLGT